MGERAFISRQERFPSVGSTNDVVATWLDEGTPEVCLAVADEQHAGRGRNGRTWTAPPGAALLLSLGFRPSWLEPDRVWRLAATASLAMADAAEEVAGLSDGAIRLKWPNDLVIEIVAPQASRGPAVGGQEREAAPGESAQILKLAGVLGETVGLGSPDPRAIVGLGINAGWRPDDFPPDLAHAMTSLFEASRGRPIDLSLLLDAFLNRLETRIEALRGGRFDVADWTARQLTTGRFVRLERPLSEPEHVLARGVDALSGALVVEDADGIERAVHAGEVRHVRLPTPARVGV